MNWEEFWRGFWTGVLKGIAAISIALLVWFALFGAFATGVAIQLVRGHLS